MTCPVCSSPSTRHLAKTYDSEYCSTNQSFDYSLCLSCDNIFINHPPIDKLSTIYPNNYYSATGTTEENFVVKIKNWLDGKLFKSLISNLNKDNVKVLDVGGGTGHILSIIKSQNPSVSETHEVDINPAAKIHAERAGHTYHCIEIDKFTTNKKFDLIIMLNLIEHVASPENVLKNVGKVLSENGRIIIKTPNHRSLDRFLFCHLNWGGFHSPRHWVLFTKKSLSELAEKCELQVLRSNYTQGAPQWTCSVLGLMAKWRWIKVSKDKPMHTHMMFFPVMLFFALFDFIRRPLFKTSQMIVELGHQRNV